MEGPAGPGRLALAKVALYWGLDPVHRRFKKEAQMRKKHVLTPLLSIALMMAACQKEKKSEPEPEPIPPEPPKVVVATATIASVQILQDCPDPKPATGTPASPKVEQIPAKPAAPAKTAPAESMPASMAPADSAGRHSGAYQPPCQQSTIQFSFAGQGAQSSKVTLKELRLLTPEGKPLATLNTRLPSVWGESVYTAWDEVLQAGKDINVSYKVAPPSWSEVEKELGGRSFGKMFLLEAVVEVGGETQTVRSSEFARFQPHAIPT